LCECLELTAKLGTVPKILATVINEKGDILYVYSILSDYVVD